MAPAPSRKKWANRKDWESQRETISKLYRDMELDELMGIMEKDHNFYSTARMYKTKIREWGIGKRLRDEDIVAILHLRSRQRDQPLEFWVRGYRINDDNIRRYLRRKPKLLNQFRNGKGPRAEDLASVTAIAKVPVDKPVSRARSPVQDAEVLMISCRDYVDGSFSSGNWIVSEDGICFSKTGGEQSNELGQGVQANFYAAVDSLNRADFSDAFKVFDISFRTASRALKLEIPRILPLVLNSIKLLQRRQQFDVLKVFLRYIRSQGQSAFGSNHKLARILEGVAKVDVKMYNDVFERIFSLLIAESDDKLGPESYLSFELFWDFFGTLIVTYDLEDQVDKLTAQLAKVSLESRERPWIMKIERLLAWKVAQWKASIGEFDEAERALRVAEGTLDADDLDDYPRHFQFAGKVFISMGNLLGAEQAFLKASQLGEKHGNEDTIQFSLEQLAKVLDMRKLPEEARRVRKYGKTRLESLAAQVDWDWDEFARRTAEEPLVDSDEEDSDSDDEDE